MAAKLTITREDLLSQTTVDPGWYDSVVKSVEEAPAKSDGSQNWNVTLLITSPGKFEGVPLKKSFNEKPSAIGFAIRYLEAFGAKIAPGEFDFQPTTNQKVKVHVSNRSYNNRMLNEADDFMPIGAKPAPNVEKAIAKP